MHLDGSTMQQIYLYLLVGGVILLFIVLLLGDLVDAITGHLDVLPFGPSEVVLFASFMGGAGLIIGKFFSKTPGITLTIASFASIILTFLISYYFLKPLKKLESSSTLSTKDMVGRKGVVVMEIREGIESLGEVKVEHELGVMFKTALSKDGKGIPLNAEVIIVGATDNRFIVSETADLLNIKYNF